MKYIVNRSLVLSVKDNNLIIAACHNEDIAKKICDILNKTDCPNATRTLIAAKCMQGILATSSGANLEEEYAELIAKESVLCSDALIRELAKTKE